MRADVARLDHHPAGMDEQDFIDLLELQRFTRELLGHLTAMFPTEEAADLLRVMAHGLEKVRREPDATNDLR